MSGHTKYSVAIEELFPAVRRNEVPAHCHADEPWRPGAKCKGSHETPVLKSLKRANAAAEGCVVARAGGSEAGVAGDGYRVSF